MPGKRSAFVSLALFLLFFPVLAALAQSQASSSRPDLQGLSGTVDIVPNARLGKTTVVFLSSTALNPTSNQIVFVLQNTSSTNLPSWSGPARLLIGDGILIVSPQESGQDYRGWVFKFAEKTLPSSVESWHLKSFAVFGIARYGETTPLTKDQIASLIDTGKFAPLAE